MRVECTRALHVTRRKGGCGDVAEHHKYRSSKGVEVVEDFDRLVGSKHREVPCKNAS